MTGVQTCALPISYFADQKKGRAYIALAPDVPLRTSSPYNLLAKLRVQTATIALGAYAESTKQFRPEQLEAKAMELLKDAEDQVRTEIQRNVFLSDPVAAPAAGKPAGGGA